MNQKAIQGLILSIILTIFSSCLTVQPRDRTLLLNPDMEPSPQAIEKYGIGVETYREGSSGGTGSSSNSGCGCY